MSKKKYPLYYCFAVLFECPYLILKYLSEFKIKKKKKHYFNATGIFVANTNHQHVNSDTMSKRTFL